MEVSMKRTVLAFLLFSILSPLALLAQQPPSNNSDVYIIPFSHLDLYWACTQEECLSRGNKIIGKALQLAEQHPEFRFLLEDDDFIANFLSTNHGNPRLDSFKQLVKTGRIEIAPTWAAIYQNEPRGEALIRNLIYGKRFAREVFGVDPKVAHLADIPGFTSQFPQILSKTDTPYMVMSRMGPPDVSLFRWQAPDGSSVLVWNEINGYGWGVDEGLHLDLDKPRLSSISQNLEKVKATTGSPIFMPWGMDLYAPSAKLIQNISVLNQQLTPYHFRWATPVEFFRTASQASGIGDIPGEIPSSWVSIASVPLWPEAMFANDVLLNAEKFAAINYALGYAEYPNKEFDTLWRDELKALDHNSDGQGGEIGDERKSGYAQEVSLGAGQILRDSLRNIAERVRSPFERSMPIVVFNPSGWLRDDVVKTHVTLFGEVATDDIEDYKQGMRLLDEKGASIPFEVEQYQESSSRSIDLVFVAREVPSFGYKTYFLVPAGKPDSFQNASEVKLDTDKDAKQAGSSIGSDVLENQYYRVAVDRATGRIQIFDKELNQIVAKDVEIRAVEERGGDAQNIVLPTGRTVINVIDRVELEENNAARTVLRIDGNLGGIDIVQRLTLYSKIRKIDLDDTIEWKPGRSLDIQQVFPILQPNAEIRNGIPFGSVDAKDVMANSGPRADDEMTPEVWKRWRQVQDWVFVGTKEWGTTISADHQLMIEDEKEIRASMIRGPHFSPTSLVRNGQPVLDLRPAAGQYVFRYSFTTSKGDWLAGKPWRAGMALSSPLVPVTSADLITQKSLPCQTSFLSLDADNVVISAVKKADVDGDIVLRMFDISGISSESPIKFLGQERGFREVNMLEQPSQTSDQKTLHMHPFEIETVKLSVH